LFDVFKWVLLLHGRVILKMLNELINKLEIIPGRHVLIKCFR
jgi:hypothetical protein